MNQITGCNFFLFGAIRLKYLALVVIGIDVLSITSSNAGGHIAHLGGALAGLWFAASLSKGTDLTSWINWILDGFTSLFQKKTWKRKPKNEGTLWKQCHRSREGL